MLQRSVFINSFLVMFTIRKNLLSCSVTSEFYVYINIFTQSEISVELSVGSNLDLAIGTH